MRAERHCCHQPLRARRCADATRLAVLTCRAAALRSTIPPVTARRAPHAHRRSLPRRRSRPVSLRPGARRRSNLPVPATSSCRGAEQRRRLPRCGAARRLYAHGAGGSATRCDRSGRGAGGSLAARQRATSCRCAAARAGPRARAIAAWSGWPMRRPRRAAARARAWRSRSTTSNSCCPMPRALWPSSSQPHPASTSWRRAASRCASPASTQLDLPPMDADRCSQAIPRSGRRRFAVTSPTHRLSTS